MLEKCTFLLTEKLNSQMHFTAEEKEVYVYGFELLLSNLITMAIICIISVILGNIFYAISFFLFFFLLRLFSGGLHASSHFKCISLTISTFIFTVIASKLFEYGKYEHFIVLMSLISFFIISLLSPIVNLNHPISRESYSKNKKISVFLSTVYLIVICFMIFKTPHVNIGIHSALSFISVSIFLIIEIIKERRNKNEKN